MVATAPKGEPKQIAGLVADFERRLEVLLRLCSGVARASTIETLGDVLRSHVAGRLKDRLGASSALYLVARSALAAAEIAVKLDPENTTYLRDLSFSYNRLADLDSDEVTNINKLLAELARRDLINSAVKLFLQGFFGRMRLKNDIGEADLVSVTKEMSGLDFNLGSYSDTNLLSGEFERFAPYLLAEGAFGAAAGYISSEDLDKMLFIFCRVHGLTETSN